MDNQGESKMSLKDKVSLVASIFNLSALGVGGFCLLVYANEISQFPEGMSLGDGLVFYFICVGFLLSYFVYSLGLVAAGWVFLWLFVLGARFCQKINPRWNNISRWRQNVVDVPMDFPVMWNWMVIPVGILAWIIIVIYVIDKKNWTFLLFPVPGAVIIWAIIYLWRQYLFSQSGILVTSGRWPNPKQKRHVTLSICSVLMVFFFTSLCLGTLSQNSLWWTRHLDLQN